MIRQGHPANRMGRTYSINISKDATARRLIDAGHIRRLISRFDTIRDVPNTVSNLHEVESVPQLTGQEQKHLIDLLIEHLSEPGQLDRALLHAGLGNLSKFSEKGTLDAMSADLVRALASQFRVVEFVESVLQGDFLKGHCPPIEAWLASNRAELLRRKLNPTVAERLQRIGSPVSSWWLLVPIALLTLAGMYQNFYPAVRVSLGPLAGQQVDLQQTSVLNTVYTSRPTRGMRELIDDIAEKADSGDYGVIFLCNALEQALESPIVEVRAVDEDGHHLDDPDGIFEIHWLPPDRDREELGRWGPKLHLKDGVVTDKYDGLVPIGTIITVVYHRKEPRPFRPKFSVWVK